MKHVICAMVQNRSGVLARISGLFSARGFNIDSLAVGETENPDISRMTIVVAGDEQVLEQVIKQLRKVIEVVKVQDFLGVDYVERDLMMVKVNTPPGKRSEILEVINIFRGKIVDVSKKDLIVEVSGPEKKLEALLDLLQPYGIVEVARTGVLAMARGAQLGARNRSTEEDA